MRRGMNDVNEVLRIYSNTRSVRATSGITGIPRSTVSDYVKRLEITGITPEEAYLLPYDELKRRLFPEKESKKPPSRNLPDVLHVATELKRPGVTWLLLWQEYKTNNPEGYSYTQFKDRLQESMSRLDPSYRGIRKAGELMPVDFSGTGIPYIDNTTIKKAEIFVSSLGASDCLFAFAVKDQKTERFNECHVHAFNYYGGVPLIVVPDNLKSAVIKNTSLELNLNESYKDLARYYGFAISPARPYKPKDKPAVENGVKIVQRWIIAALRNHRFFSVSEINEAILPLLNKYNERKLRGVNKSRFELLKELDLPSMKELPAKDYIYRIHVKRKVPRDYHIEIDGSFYSVPFSLITDTVDVWHSKSSVEIYHNGVIAAIHPKTERNTSTLPEHMPLNHKIMKERFNPKNFLNWGLSIGFNTAGFIKKIMEKKINEHLMFRNLSFIKKLSYYYPKEEFESACKKALSLNATDVKYLKGILDKKDKAENDVLNSHENLRGKSYYEQ